MPRVWYMFFILLIAFVAVFLIFVMFTDHSTNHLIATDLNQAVTEDLEDSNDNSSRMERGTYAINENNFENVLANHMTIKDLNSSKDPKKDYDFIIRFQADNNSTDKDNVDYINDYSNEEDTSQKTNHVTPIRAVQVIAVPKNDTIDTQGKKLSLNQINYDLENPNSSNQAKQLSQAVNKHKYVSTVELQESDLDANNDTYNSQDVHKQNDNNNNNATDLSDNN